MDILFLIFIILLSAVILYLFKIYQTKTTLKLNDKCNKLNHDFLLSIQNTTKKV